MSQPPKNKDQSEELLELMTVFDVAQVLRTTPKAIYAMKDRGLLPRHIQIGRRILYPRAGLLQWLKEKRAASPDRSWR